MIQFSVRGLPREAFRSRGFDAWSCDLRNSWEPTPYHLKCDALDAIASRRWDLLIAFPPCTYLAVSGARWWKDRQREQVDALEFIRRLMAAPVDRIAIENPIGLISAVIRKPDQIIQPWMFGHGETKATCR